MGSVGCNGRGGGMGCVECNGRVGGMGCVECNGLGKDGWEVLGVMVWGRRDGMCWV